MLKLDSGYGITATGFNKKTYNDLMSNLGDNLRSDDLFGADIDFSDLDPLKHFSAPVMEVAAELWELAEQVFYSASPKYAEGNPLSATGKYIGISRKQATKAKGTERFNGTAGVNIPIGYIIGTENDISFITTESGLIAASGYIDLSIEAVNVGSSGNTPVNTITKIINPLIGLNSITNIMETIGGQDMEADTNFRTRYAKSTATGAGSTTDAIAANVLKMNNVIDCIATENYEDTTVNNIPPHAIETLVKGGNDVDIAQAIFEKKPGGIKVYGTTTVNVTDSQGVTHPISFSRPTNTNVWIKVDVTTTSDFPSDGNTQIQTAVITYINSLKLGEDVKIYKISAAITALKLSGIDDMSITLSTDGTTYNASNVAIDTKAIAVTDTSKIEVV